ncbi:hypothetical protein J3F83DRAFT_202037 [Trichoderma novae-zelandiae]
MYLLAAVREASIKAGERRDNTQKQASDSLHCSSCPALRYPAITANPTKDQADFFFQGRYQRVLDIHIRTYAEDLPTIYHGNTYRQRYQTLPGSRIVPNQRNCLHELLPAHSTSHLISPSPVSPPSLYWFFSAPMPLNPASPSPSPGNIPSKPEAGHQVASPITSPTTGGNVHPMFFVPQAFLLPTLSTQATTSIMYIKPTRNHLPKPSLASELQSTLAFAAAATYCA